MFDPKYTITHNLLENIKRIDNLVNELNYKRFPNVVLLEFERVAREVSTYASTSIEGNPLPLTEVKKVLKSKPQHIRDSEKEVINYNQALKELNELLRTSPSDKEIEKDKVEISLELILKIQKQVTEGLLLTHESGNLRQRPVVVNDSRSGQVIFLPPDVQDVKPMMQDLIFFMNENKGRIDSLILAGIFHKQMVLIHPFIDGNGRTTRLATKVLLAQMNLNTFNLFSFENYYNKNVTKYFQSVGELGNYYELKDSIDFTSWLEYFTVGIIDELLRVQKLLSEVGISPETQLQEYHLKMLDYIKENGFVTNRDYAKLSDRAKATRTLDFQKLMELGLIERRGKGRATYYVLKTQ
ncbi:MAG: Fic family protein [Candidatus Blackburnbacteria bacterium]|nr:Fic family protein [Candidatus Blackburnbacteria bacterium]